jgi:hypothetical protein
MITDSLLFIKARMNASSPAASSKIELGNISVYNDGDAFNADLQNKILLSLINVEEDTVARSVDYYKKNNTQIKYTNPPVYLNLTLMFAATHTDYESALISLEQVVLFFQRNRYYTVDSSPELAAYNQVHNVQVEKITFEIVNLNLEQLHQVWSGLGGHYMPSVIYKMRMLQIDTGEVTGTATPILEINVDAFYEDI